MKAGAIASAFYLMRDTHFNAARRWNMVSRATACGAEVFCAKKDDADASSFSFGTVVPIESLYGWSMMCSTGCSASACRTHTARR